MTSSAAELPWGLQVDKPVRLRSLHSGLRRVEKALKRCGEMQLGEARLAEIEDHLCCIRHEISFLEDYPAHALGQIQKERLDHLCHGALALLDSEVSETTLPLREAFLSLSPLVAKDFANICKATV